MKLTVEKLDPLTGSITVPGDKSVSHRAAILCSLAEGRSLVRNLAPGRDTASTVACMRMLGARIEAGPDGLVIKGRGLHGLSEPASALDCGNSGTTARLLMGLAAGQSFATSFRGDESLSQRPMGRVARPLRLMGAVIDGAEGGERLPLTVRGGRLMPIDFDPPVASAQLMSSIMLAALYAEGESTVAGRPGARDHTERMLEAMKGPLKRIEGGLAVTGGGRLEAADVDVPGDISSAAFFMGLALMVPQSELAIDGVGLNPTRTGVISILRRMGASIDVKHGRAAGPEPAGAIEVRHGELRAVKIGPEEIAPAIDEIPLIAVVATAAHGTTEVRGAAELRVKETDRIAAIAAGLRSMGAAVEEFPDGFSIAGPVKLRGAKVRSFGDHRIAMSLAVAGATASGTTVIDDASCIDISFPGFAALLARFAG